MRVRCARWPAGGENVEDYVIDRTAVIRTETNWKDHIRTIVYR
jgi:hypothetical protein